MNIKKGFDFLGVNIPKYKGKLLCRPSKGNIKTFLLDLRHTIKSNATAKTENLIYVLNPKIRGWANYHSHICAKATFAKVDAYIFGTLWRWAKRRHPNKGAGWIQRKYFRHTGNRRWTFYAISKDIKGDKTYLELIEAKKTLIKRHIKIQAEASPYHPSYFKYSSERVTRSKGKAREYVEFLV